VGGVSAYSTSAWVLAEPPPTPDPSPPLRGGRGEERTGVLERESSSKHNHATALAFAGSTVRYNFKQRYKHGSAISQRNSPELCQ
jgi:hypothetical protein